MTPLEFMTGIADNGYNMPVGAIAEALHKPLIITDGEHYYEVLSYYYDVSGMVIDIQKKDDHVL